MKKASLKENSMRLLFNDRADTSSGNDQTIGSGFFSIAK
jgi:hypothetical protein